MADSTPTKADELVKEGFKIVQTTKTTKKGIETIDKGIKMIEKEIEEAVSFGRLAQVRAMARVEVVGILLLS